MLLMIPANFSNDQPVQNLATPPPAYTLMSASIPFEEVIADEPSVPTLSPATATALAMRPKRRTSANALSKQNPTYSYAGRAKPRSLKETSNIALQPPRDSHLPPIPTSLMPPPSPVEETFLPTHTTSRMIVPEQTPSYGTRHMRTPTMPPPSPTPSSASTSSPPTRALRIRTHSIPEQPGPPPRRPPPPTPPSSRSDQSPHASGGLSTASVDPQRPSLPMLQEESSRSTKHTTAKAYAPSTSSSIPSHPTLQRTSPTRQLSASSGQPRYCESISI